MFPNSDTSETQSNETHECTAARRSRVKRLSAALLVAMTLVVGITAAGQLSVAEAAGTVVAVDDAGADDEPGQKDLNWLSIDYGAPGATALTVKWGWDDTATSGANTRDAGSLFDTDGDGFANYSLYVTVATDGSYTTQLYSCEADSRTDRCAGPALAGTFASTATVAMPADSDPFGVPASADFDAAHVTGNTCRDTAGCYTQDTVATANIQLADFGNPADAFLLNVCSYPSGEPNSDPSDCVFAPNNGFLTIVKVANPDDGTSFPFNASAQSEPGDTSWTITGSGSQSLISYGPTTTLDLSEAVPAGWKLDSASCAIQTAAPTATGTSTGTGIDNLEIRSGLETICTFNDSLAQGTLRVIKQVVNDNGGTKAAADFTLHVKSGGTDVAGSPAAGSASGTRLHARVWHVRRQREHTSGGLCPDRDQRRLRGGRLRHGRGRSAEDLHDHEQRRLGEADRDQERRQRRGRHQRRLQLHDVRDRQLAEPGQLPWRRRARHAGAAQPGFLRSLGDRPGRIHRLVLARLQRLDLARRDEDLHGHEQRQRHSELDPRHEDGGSGLAPRAGRERRILGVGQEHVGASTRSRSRA